MRKLLTGTTAALVLAGATLSAVAPAEARHYGGYGGGRGYYGGGYRGGSGAALAAGIIGLGVGAAIASNSRYGGGYYGGGGGYYGGGVSYYAPPAAPVRLLWRRRATAAMVVAIAAATGGGMAIAAATSGSSIAIDLRRHRRQGRRSNPPAPFASALTTKSIRHNDPFVPSEVEGRYRPRNAAYLDARHQRKERPTARRKPRYTSAARLSA